MFTRRFFFSLLPLAAGSAHAAGFTQVQEARPWLIREEALDDHLGVAALDLVFGSNVFSWFGPVDDSGGPGSYSAINWTNNGDFYAAHFAADIHFGAALAQRTTWLSSEGGRLPSYPGLNSIWIDCMFLRGTEDSEWSQALVLSPGVSSDFKDIGGRMFRLPAQLSVRWRGSKAFALELGVAYTPDFVRTPVAPLLGFVWEPAPGWEIAGRFTTLTVTRRLMTDATLGVFASYDEASWISGEKRATTQVSFTAATAGATYSQGFRFTEKLPARIDLALGANFAGELRSYDPSGENLLRGVRLDPGFFASFGLKIDF